MALGSIILDGVEFPGEPPNDIKFEAPPRAEYIAADLSISQSSADAGTARRGRDRILQLNWNRQVNFMAQLLHDRVMSLASIGRPFWVFIDDEWLRDDGAKLACVDSSNTTFLTPDYPVQPYLWSPANPVGWGECVAVNGVVVPTSRYEIDEDYGIVTFLSPLLSSDVVTIRYRACFCGIIIGEPQLAMIPKTFSAHTCTPLPVYHGSVTIREVADAPVFNPPDDGCLVYDESSLPDDEGDGGGNTDPPPSNQVFRVTIEPSVAGTNYDCIQPQTFFLTWPLPSGIGPESFVRSIRFRRKLTNGGNGNWLAPSSQAYEVWTARPNGSYLDSTGVKAGDSFDETYTLERAAAYSSPYCNHSSKTLDWRYWAAKWGSVLLQSMPLAENYPDITLPPALPNDGVDNPSTNLGIWDFIMAYDDLPTNRASASTCRFTFVGVTGSFEEQRIGRFDEVWVQDSGTEPAVTQTDYTKEVAFRKSVVRGEGAPGAPPSITDIVSKTIVCKTELTGSVTPRITVLRPEQYAFIELEYKVTVMAGVAELNLALVEPVTDGEQSVRQIVEVVLGGSRYIYHVVTSKLYSGYTRDVQIADIPPDKTPSYLSHTWEETRTIKIPLNNNIGVGSGLTVSAKAENATVITAVADYQTMTAESVVSAELIGVSCGGTELALEDVSIEFEFQSLSRQPVDGAVSVGDFASDTFVETSEAPADANGFDGTLTLEDEDPDCLISNFVDAVQAIEGYELHKDRPVTGLFVQFEHRQVSSGLSYLPHYVVSGSLDLDYVGDSVWPEEAPNLFSPQDDWQTYTLDMAYHLPTSLVLSKLEDVEQLNLFFRRLSYSGTGKVEIRNLDVKIWFAPATEEDV